ncbi:MAG: hypothetical protein HY549_03375 [Elusimicrobia bacterium]|nr:hypothetical protein [Elusimicrobiota bacterium]
MERGTGEWEYLGRRLFRTLAFLALILGLGLFQRWWAGFFEDKSGNDPIEGVESLLAPSPEAQRYRQQVEALQQRLKAMTPEDRALYQQFIEDFRVDSIGNPIIMGLSRPAKRGTADRWRLKGAGLAMRAWVFLAWLVASAYVGLWAVVGGLSVLVLAGHVLGREGSARATVAAGANLAWAWLWLLSLICTGIFALTGRNFWSQIPMTFYLGPAVMFVVFIYLGAGERWGKTWLKALESALAPLSSAAMLWLASIWV